MSLHSPAALLLLAALAVLAWLAWRSARPVRLETGTLFLWQRVLARHAAPAQRRRRVEPLLWLLAAATALAALGAAGPAWTAAAGAPRVAVFIEPLSPSDVGPGLAEVLDRAAQAAPGADLHVWSAALPEEDSPGRWHVLARAPLAAQLAQFERESAGLEARLYFLCRPDRQPAEVGLVLPRVTAARPAVIFEARSEGESVFLRSGGGAGARVEGASFRGAVTSGDEVEREYAATSAEVHVRGPGQSLVLRRDVPALGVGPQWAGTRHAALLAALGGPSGAGTPEAWLGAEDARPALRLQRGVPTDLAGAELAVDPLHPLFRELPLQGLELGADGRAIAPAPGLRPLASFRRGAEIVGHAVVLSADGRALDFAGDPFAASTTTVAALLLDNAIGVLTGTRPTDRPLYRLVQGELPSRRQAMAAAFEAQGELRTTPAPGRTLEASPWLLVAAALLALAATGVAVRLR
ncbi:MAG: hypothetical protein KF754_06540 [Planctomycetes bacterium]|nr:hypothetical protein [Planctomycetota bacterium]